MSSRGRVSATGAGSVSIGGDALGPVSATYIGTQVLGISSVPLVVAAKDPGAVFTAVGVEGFTGRDWLVAELDRFIGASPCGYVLVEADAGVGKTALAAWLVRTRNYISHFSRYADGRRTRAALQNLSAQLIRDAGLTEQAPGGMLPEWVQTPAGFESLLGMAALAVGPRPERLVLVVDGLDEAEPPGDGLPFGLPMLLPAGVFVIGTYRTGYSLARPDCPVLDVRIGKDDPQNYADINAYLRRVACEDVLAARLAEAGLSVAEFADLLAGRCEGVWVYLRYVLEELRLGLRQADAIGELPSGLWDYYSGQVRRWQSDTDWDRELLPLLATLGVAGEPLTAAVLARLAGGLSETVVRRRCDQGLRPLLNTSPGAGASLRYEIYHASFRNVLKGLHDPSQGGHRAARPYDQRALADELGRASVAAHSHAADAYLASFGGLDSGLPLLGARPRKAQADGGYSLRHLARHLHHAGRADQLHHLLGTQHQTSAGHAANIWFTAHDHAATLGLYLDDLARARSIAATSMQDALPSRPIASALGLDIRYALMAASVISRVQKIPLPLLEKLIRAGAWSTVRALDHARRFTDPVELTKALLIIYRYAAAHDQPAILTEAIAAATLVTDKGDHAKILVTLVPHLPTDQRADSLPKILADTAAITDQFSRASALAGLAPYLPAELLPEALTATLSLTLTRPTALAALAPHLSAELLAEALKTTQATSPEEGYHARSLAALAPHLPPELLARAADHASAIDFDYSRAKALAALVPHLPDDQRARVLPQALAAAHAISRADLRGETLASLAPYLPTERQAETRAPVLNTGSLPAPASDGLAPDRPAITLVLRAHEDLSASASAESALDKPVRTVLSKALAATATAIADERQRAEALTALAPHLPAAKRAGALAEALAAATAVADERERAEVQIALAPHLPPDTRADALAQALAAARAVAKTSERARALVAVAPHLPSDTRIDVLAQALAAAMPSDEFGRTEALTWLLPHLPDELLAQALADCTIGDDHDRAYAVSQFAPYLPANLLAQALTTTAAVSDEDYRTRAMGALAPHLPAGLLPQALKATDAISDGDYRARALAALIPHLPDDLRLQVIETITAMPDDVPRTPLLAALAPHLSTEFLGQTLTLVPAINDDISRRRAMRALIPHLPDELLPEALAAASTITRSQDRADTLTALAPRLPADLLAQALAAANAITDDGWRAHTLAGLGPHLTPDLLAQALAAAIAITDDNSVAGALAGLAPRLPADLLPQALAAAAALTSDRARAKALAGLAPHLPADRLMQALAAAPRGNTRTLIALMARAQTVLAPSWHNDFMDLFRYAVGGQNRQTCLTIIAAIAPTIARIGGLDAAQECAFAIAEVCLWWP